MSNDEDVGLAVVRGPEDPPIRDITVGDLLREAVDRAPNRLAVIDTSHANDGRRWTYLELLDDAEACARAMLQRFDPGDRIAIFAPNVADYTVFQFGAALAGMVMVTMNPTFKREEARYSLQQSDAVACFAYPEFRGSRLHDIALSVAEELPGLREVISFGEEWKSFLDSGRSADALPSVDPYSAAQIQYTSGTTGEPKGALLCHRGMANDAFLAARRAGGQEGAVWLATLPMFHVGGCVLAGLGAASLAGTLVPLLTFDAQRALELVEQEHVTIMNPVPTMLIGMMQDETFGTRDLSSLTSVISGGAPVPADLVRQIESTLGVDFTIVLGMTETSGVVTMTTVDDSARDKAETCGTPLPGIEVKIADPETGDTLRFGEVGEFLTRGFHTMLGYYGKPGETAEALDDDGWMHTGDLCSMDERGYLTIEGRVKDMIIRGGENVYPREIEDILFQHSDVVDAAVVGLPDDYYGECVGAFIRRAGDATTATELAEFLESRLSGYKIPSKWYFVDEFPQTLSGKIQKFEIRRQWQEGVYDGSEAMR